MEHGHGSRTLEGYRAHPVTSLWSLSPQATTTTVEGFSWASVISLVSSSSRPCSTMPQSAQALPRPQPASYVSQVPQSLATTKRRAAGRCLTSTMLNMYLHHQECKRRPPLCMSHIKQISGMHVCLSQFTNIHTSNIHIESNTACKCPYKATADV